MTNFPNARIKKSKAISLTPVQAELFGELAREERALAREILAMIWELRQSNNLLMQVSKSVSAAYESEGRMRNVTNARIKKSKAISLTLVQAELFRELTREERALAREILAVIWELRQSNNLLMQVSKSVSAAYEFEGRIIHFPAPPHIN